MPLDLFSRKLVLLVEDELLIANDVEHHLRKAGARMTEHPDLSGPVVND